MRWLPVVGYEGLYEVSDTGQVRSLSRVVPSRGGSRRTTGKTLSLVIVRGRPTVQLSKGGKVKTERVHRLVATAFLGDPQPGQEVCHNDGDSMNNCVTNLRWGTRLSNVRDAIEHGTHVSVTSRKVN